MLRKLTALAAVWTSLAAMQAPQASGTVSLWRLDCGNATIKDYNAFFSDTSAYKPAPKEITDSCYLIRHGDSWMLWDAGPSARRDRPCRSAAWPSRNWKPGRYGRRDNG